MTVENDWEPDMSAPFPGSPDDMMDTIAALRARVAQLEAACARAASYLEHDERHPELLAQLDAALKDALPMNFTKDELIGQYQGQIESDREELLALRARVAQLEAALKHAQEYMRPNSLLKYGPSLREMLDAALKDAPQ